MTETPSLMAFLDASVLYPNLTRNLLVSFGVAGVYQPRWSARVHEEWISAPRRNRPDIPASKIERIRTLMDSHIHDALVEGYEHWIASLTLPDMDDRHVLAAAIHGGATIIVTMNLRDFPASTLAAFGITPEHPDTFLSRLLNVDHVYGVAIFHDLCQDYKRTPRYVTASMKKHGLTVTADTLNILLEAH
jgi:hypothetical protein